MKAPLFSLAPLAALMWGAVVIPGPLYLVSLALLGLPHVIWELAFMRSRYHGRWPVGWLALIGGLLGIQVILRAATWLGLFSGVALQVADLLVLIFLLIAVLVAPREVGWLSRAGALVGAVAVAAVLHAGHITTALLMLAMLHNFTPVGLAWNMAQEDANYRPLALQATWLFMLPLAVVALGSAGWWPEPWIGAGQEWLLAQSPLLPSGVAPGAGSTALQASLVSAMVLAQCLHYYYVLRVLPAAEARRTGYVPMPPRAQRFALAASGALTLYFVWAFADARQLYAVAAGLHAWLEWPVLLLVLLSPRGPATSALKSSQPAHL